MSERLRIEFDERAPLHIVVHTPDDITTTARLIHRLHLLNLRLKAQTRHLRRALKVTVPLRSEAYMSADPTTLDEAIDQLNVTEADENEVVGLVIARIAEFPAILQAAVDEARKKGATPEQLAAIVAVKAQMATDAQNMKAALDKPVA